MFSGDAIKEIAKIALERGTGARGLRSVIEEVLEPVLFEVEAGVRFVITDKTVKGGEVVRQRVGQIRAPLSGHLMRRFGVRNSA